MECTNQIWINNIKNLICSTSFIPTSSMSEELKFNALSRLSILVFLVLTLFLDFKRSFLFLLISILVFIILYYVQKTKMKEPYSPLKGVIPPTALRFCNDEHDMRPNDSEVIYPSQRLQGKPNPKTLIQPVITPPSHDLQYWKANNLITHSRINESTNFDMSRSGYLPNNKPVISLEIPNKKPTMSEYVYDLHMNRKPLFGDTTPFNGKDNVPEMSTAIPLKVNTACGYNPEQVMTSNLPVNLATGPCQKQPQLKEFNKQLFTQVLSPGDTYVRNEIIEPISSNIGISFQDQLPATRLERNNDGTTTIVQGEFSDEDIIQPLEEDTIYNVVDPRFSGYGTSYRSYEDDMLGNTKFYYDDINAIRMPNYITRNKLDVFSFAPKYGPMQEQDSTANIRSMANQQFLDSTLQFRTGMQYSLMEKNNNIRWQQRMMPIRKF